jgi:hypothetical protein
MRARACRGNSDSRRQRDIDAELGWSPVRDVPKVFADLLSAAQHAVEQHVDVADGESADALVNAWESIVDHPLFASAPSDFRVDVLNRSAIALDWRAAVRSITFGLNIALDRYQEAIQLVEPKDPRQVGFLSNMASARLKLYQLGGNLSDLDAAIVASQRAVALATAGASPFEGVAARSAAYALEVRFRKTGDPLDISRAVELAEAAVRVGESRAVAGRA